MRLLGNIVGYVIVVIGALATDPASVRLDVRRLGRTMLLRHQLTARQIGILRAGGLLNLARRTVRPLADVRA